MANLALKGVMTDRGCTVGVTKMEPTLKRTAYFLAAALLPVSAAAQQDPSDRLLDVLPPEVSAQVHHTTVGGRKPQRERSFCISRPGQASILLPLLVS